MPAVAEPPTAQKKPSLEEIPSTVFFKRIVERAKGKPLWLERITAHIRVSTGHSTLPSFQTATEMTAPDGQRAPLTEDFKRALYAQILRAIMAAEKGAPNPFGDLLGHVAAGQASAEPAPPPPAKEEEPTTSPPPPIVKPAPAGKPADPPAIPKSTNPIAQAILSEMGPFLEHLARQAGPAQLDEEQLEKTIRDSVKQLGNEMMTDLTARADIRWDGMLDKLSYRVDEYLKKIPPRDVIEIRENGKVKLELKGLVHKQFKIVHGFVTARRFHDGFPVCLYAWGSPGSGKSRMFLTLAQAMGLEDRYFPYSCKEDDTTAKIIGYQNLATGAYVPGIVYEPYKNGGLCVLSEIDLPAGIITGLNNLIEGDRFTFPNGETVMRHKDFYLVADANTIGKGAVGGFIRAKMDAATRTRWAFLKIEYDLDLERSLVPDKFRPWVDYVVKLRTYIEANCKDTVYITPRAVINGAALLHNGVPPDVVADSILFTDIPANTKATIIANCGKVTL